MGLRIDADHKYRNFTPIAELGMYYYKARIYSPTLGRFLQTDPIGYKDQVNLYAYVGNDPVDNTDPSGLACTGSLTSNCDTASPAYSLPGGAPQSTVKYTEKLLSQDITVGIYEGDDTEQAEIRSRIDSAVSLINSKQNLLSAFAVDVISGIKGITVKDGPRTGTNVRTGIYNMRTTYVVDKNSGIPLIASSIVHDSYHVYQHHHGQENTRRNKRYDPDANRFQLEVGLNLGISAADRLHIETDKHTYYNTDPY